MDILLPLTYLNDFIFCPYSVYLHQVFDNSEEITYHAEPQQKGRNAHQTIDEPKAQKNNIIKGIYVLSQTLGIYGKIDTFYPDEGRLVESKYRITTLYKGYYYQLWGQYFALTEMGYEVKELCFYSISDKKTFPVPVPQHAEFEELQEHIKNILHFDFEQEIKINPAKCSRCIYASLCDKTNIDHVYA
jgi:CRISPR-associated protein Cas4